MVYTILLLLLLFGIFHFEKRQNIFFDKAYYILLFILFTLMTGLRYKVGGDALMYEEYYDHMPSLQWFQFGLKETFLGYQPLYILFVAICKEFSPDYYFYQLVHSVLVNSVLFWFIYTHSRKGKYSVLLVLYVFLFYFYFTFDIQREILAICCFLLGFNFFIKGKWWAYYLFAILAFLFHISATILLLLPLFKLVKFNSRIALIIILVTLPLVFTKQIVANLLSFLFFTDAMKNKAEAYGEYGFSIVGVLSFYFTKVIVILPFMFSSIIEKYKQWHWLFVYILVFSIFSQIFVGMERLLNYMYIPYIILIIKIVKDLKLSGEFSFRNKFAVAMVYVSFFFVLLYKIPMDWGVTDRAKYQEVFFPYSSVFDKEENPERERFMIELWKRTN